jgi:hypothetical protein
MKRLFALPVILALAACSQSEPAPAPEETPEAAEVAQAEPLAADGLATPGMYKITAEDGTVFMENVKPDGTYEQTKDGEVVETGKWEQKDPATYCYTKDEEGAQQICNTEAIGADGVWTSTNPDGRTSTVERVTE